MVSSIVEAVVKVDDILGSILPTDREAITVRGEDGMDTYFSLKHARDILLSRKPEPSQPDGENEDGAHEDRPHEANREDQERLPHGDPSG